MKYGYISSHVHYIEYDIPFVSMVIGMKIIHPQAYHPIFRWVNDVSSSAHVETMRRMRGGQREHLAEATFKYQAREQDRKPYFFQTIR
jgi:hypothetical protein